MVNFERKVVVNISGKCNNDQIVISLETLSSGTYYVLLQVDNKTIASKKLVKINE